MPNRIIKESICTSENLDHLTAEEERFFYRLLVSCDDFGVLDARTAILKSKCFPLKEDISKEEVERWLERLVQEGLAMLYEAEGRPYLKLTTWESHQRIRNKRHKYPLPCNDLSADTETDNLLQPAADCGNVRPESESESNPNPNQKEESESQSKRAGRIAFADNVYMTREEYDEIVSKIGQAGAKRAIEILGNYKGASGKQYASDYRAILSWVLKRVEEEGSKGAKGYGQRTYDAAHFAREREESDRALDAYYAPD